MKARFLIILTIILSACTQGSKTAQSLSQTENSNGGAGSVSTPSPTPAPTATPIISPTPTPTPTPKPSVSPTPNPSPTGTPKIEYFGRFDWSDSAGPKFQWSASSIRARFVGPSVSVTLKNTSAFSIYFEIVIDNKTPFIINSLPNSTNKFLLASGLDSSAHEVLVFRNTEAKQYSSQFLGFDFGTDGKLLSPLAPLSPLRLEVVGDSITAGYGDLSTNCTWSIDTESAYETYPAKTARILGANPPTMIAVSGGGIYRNNGGQPNDPIWPTLPIMFNRTMASQSLLWPFPTDQNLQPNVVLVNLGTNDIWSKTALASDPLTETFVSFSKTIRSHYPKAKIILAEGPLLTGNQLTRAQTAIKAAVSQLNSGGDSNVFYLEFAIAQAPMGCDGHPSGATHTVMANKLVSFLHTLGF